MRMPHEVLLQALKSLEPTPEVMHYLREVEAQPPCAWIQVQFDVPAPYYATGLRRST